MRRRNKSGAMVLGGFLLVAAFPLLFWNEGRAVRTARALAEGAKKVITVAAAIVDENNEAALVHVTAEAETAGSLSDTELAVSVNAIQLRRTAEMYQWEERQEGEDSGGVYYRQAWSEELIPSEAFARSDRNNPVSMPLETASWTAQEVSLGAFWLSADLIKQMDAFEPVSFSGDLRSTVSGQLGLEVEADNDYLYLPFAGGTLTTPQVGDVRVKLEQVLPAPVSVVAQQQGNTLTGYKTRSGRQLEMLRAGKLSADDMFEAAVTENNVMTWFVRVFGFGFMAAGIRFLFAPLVAISQLIPGLGALLRLGVNAVALVSAFVLSLFTVAIAWFSYRPLVTLPLLLLGIGAIVLVPRLAKSTPNKLA